MDHAQEHCGKGIDVLCIGDKRYNPLFSSNLLQLLNQVSYQVPDRTALAAKRNGQWVKWTFAEYEEQVASIRKNSDCPISIPTGFFLRPGGQCTC